MMVRRMMARARRNEDGITLIELFAALFVLGLGVWGVRRWMPAGTEPVKTLILVGSHRLSVNVSG
jgi:hypothetical protein